MGQLEDPLLPRPHQLPGGGQTAGNLIDSSQTSLSRWRIADFGHWPCSMPENRCYLWLVPLAVNAHLAKIENRIHCLHHATTSGDACHRNQNHQICPPCRVRTTTKHPVLHALQCLGLQYANASTRTGILRDHPCQGSPCSEHSSTGNRQHVNRLSREKLDESIMSDCLEMGMSHET